MANETNVSTGAENNLETTQNRSEGGGSTGANLRDDSGMRRDLAGWAIAVGLAISIGGAVMLIFFGSQIPHPAALTLCVGFGIVLAAFGSRAAGSWGGFAVVGAGALAVLLFLLLEYFIPKDPIAFAKRGTMVGDFSKVAELRIVDEDPLYSRHDRTTRSIRFIVLDRKFKTPQISIQVDTTEKGEGREFFQMVGDSNRLSQKYLESDKSVIAWAFDYHRRVVKDGNDVIFGVPEELNEGLVGDGRKATTSLRSFELFGRAIAAEQPMDLIENLSVDDPAIRRNARDGLTTLGPSAVPAMMAALRGAPDNYRLKAGIILSLSEMLRSNDRLREQISKALTASDISTLVSTAASDKDPTVRLQTTDFLYRLRDARSVNPALGGVKNASDEKAAYNSTLILKSIAPTLSEAEKKRVGTELSVSKSSRDTKSQDLIDSVIKSVR
jgi:hypothetical protein